MLFLTLHGYGVYANVLKVCAALQVPGVGLTPVAAAAPQTTSTELSKAADLAKKSTASLGKFQRKLPTALDKQVGL